MISNLCDLYGKLDDLRMTCPEKREVIDRRTIRLHQMNLLVNQLEKTWTDAVCHPEPAAESGVSYEMHERVTGIMSAIQDVMVNIQGEKSV